MEKPKKKIRKNKKKSKKAKENSAVIEPAVLEFTRPPQEIGGGSFGGGFGGGGKVFPLATS